jgi:hypothetical protein
VLERFHRTMKTECLRRIVVPFVSAELRAELEAFVRWYNVHRPHATLGGATPEEIRERRRPACKRPRLEPRGRYPVRGKIRGKAGDGIHLVVTSFEGRKHLPVVELRPRPTRRAA